MSDDTNPTTDRPGVADLMPAGTCPLLRTKTMRLSPDYRRPSDVGDDWMPSTTSIFWCLKTMSVKGPDEDDCHPFSCRDGRACFKGPRTIES